MLNRIIFCTFLTGFLIMMNPALVLSQSAVKEIVIKEKLEYHPSAEEQNFTIGSN